MREIAKRGAGRNPVSLADMQMMWDDNAAPAVA